MARKIKKRGALCALLLSIALLCQTAYAEETYVKHTSGEVYVEMGINEGNSITMTKESILIDASSGELGDELSSKITSSYILSNAMPEESVCLIALTKVMKVKKIQVDAVKVKKYKSGVVIKVDGAEKHGYIFPIGTKKKLANNSAYKDKTEALAHVNYLSYYNEAYKKYESTGVNNYSKTADYYVPSEDGEEMVCAVVYELHFDSLESKEVVAENSVKGMLNRPFKETRYGSTFSFTCVGDNLSSFYSVKDVEIAYKFSDNEELGYVSCDGPIYTMNNVYTQRYKGGFDEFTFVVGHELTEEEINDVWASSGKGRKFIDLLQVVGTAIIAVSVMYLIFSIKKRKQSGIGTDVNNYFSC